MSRNQNPLRRVDVTEVGAKPRRGWNQCKINRDVRFSTEHLESYCFAEWDERVYDALLVAAVVEYCDRLQRRPSHSWGRKFEVRIPVHSTSLWQNRNVSKSLSEALAFLTGDEWIFEFAPRKKAAIKLGQTQFDLPETCAAVIPFSDGLDSRAVAALSMMEIGESLVRVRIGTGSWERETLARKRLPFTSVPYKVQSSHGAFVESSARSRGFKFGLISALAAYLSRAPRVIMTESGQGALGPALVTVGQSYEDYRNHPLFTDRLSKFVEALLNYKVRFEYPRIWCTKAETLKLFTERCGAKAEWITTRSCWQQSRQVSVDGVRRQCGVCAACLLRRMSIHAAFLEEPQSNYVWENLNASTFEKGAAKAFPRQRMYQALREYAIAGTLHLDHLASLHESSINRSSLELNAFQLGLSLGLSHTEASVRLTSLLSRHNNEWKGFMSSLSSASFLREWAEMGRP
jgi:hypothetical protein